MPRENTGTLLAFIFLQYSVYLARSEDDLEDALQHKDALVWCGIEALHDHNICSRSVSPYNVTLVGIKMNDGFLTRMTSQGKWSPSPCPQLIMLEGTSSGRGCVHGCLRHDACDAAAPVVTFGVYKPHPRASGCTSCYADSYAAAVHATCQAA
jgi:hypothetical protein